MVFSISQLVQKARDMARRHRSQSPAATTTDCSRTSTSTTVVGSNSSSPPPSPPPSPKPGAAPNPPDDPHGYVPPPQPQANAGLRYDPNVGQPLLRPVGGAQHGRLTFHAPTQGMMPLYTERAVEEIDERIRARAAARRAEAQRAPVGHRASLAAKIRFFGGR